MNETVLKAISDFLVDNDHPGMVVSFVAAVETMNDDGTRSVFTLAPDNQLPHTGLGLLAVADIEFREQIQNSFYLDCDHGLEE